MPPEPLKAKNIVFVHGLFGWGPGELGDTPYWGQARAQFSQNFTTHEAKCGPLSSFHDRACELYAQIKGTPVDYGEKHSNDAEHERRPSRRDYSGKGFVPDWSEENPVILVGHSAGAHTCLQMQALLEQRFWDKENNANWVEAVICVAGVLNGSTLTYKFCDERSGKLNGLASDLIGRAVGFLSAFQGMGRFSVLDLYLDQWLSAGTPNLAAVLQAIDATKFVSGEDNLAYDLTLQGCRAANSRFSSNAGTYYLSLVTNASSRRALFGVPLPLKSWRIDPRISPLLSLAGAYQASRPDFGAPPIPGWGAGDLTIDNWRENDGAVSAVSQRYPFTAKSELLGGEGVFGRADIRRGRWYFERLDRALDRPFDHFDPVAGGGSALGRLLKPLDVGLPAAHVEVYRKLNALLATL